MFAVRTRDGVDFVRLHRAERLPKPQQGLRLGFVDVKRLDRQAAGQLFDLAVTQSGGVRAAVKDADGFDFVFVVFDELTKTGDQCFGSLFGFGVKTGGQQLVSCELVDHLMLGTQQDFAQLGVVEREQGGADLFGFDDAGDINVNVEAVVGFAGCELELAHCNAKPGHDVHVGHVLYIPAALSKLTVDVLAV